MSSVTVSTVSAPKVPKAGKAKAAPVMSAEAAKYEKMDPITHVLKRSGMYIGSIEKTDTDVMVLDEAGKFEQKTLNFSGGLLKIYDEIIVNAVDATCEDPTCTVIKITVDPETPSITVFNSGKGIPVEKNPEGIWIPELIFANLLSGSNFNDDNERLAGGMNGLGSKLTNIFSKEFRIRTGNYTQTCRDNLSVIEPPKIGGKKLEGVEIKFVPDLARFDTTLEEYRGVVAKLFEARVYDLCATTGDNVKVYFNGKMLKVKSLSHYIGLFPGETKPVIDESCEQWKVGVLPAAKFGAVGWVNSIVCSQGSHVNHVVNQLVDAIAATKKFSGKDGVKAMIKSHLQVFVVAGIVNPTFDSQCKTKLTSAVGKFKYKYKPSEDMVKKTLKIVAELVEADLARSVDKQVAKTDGVKRVNLRINGLEDAHYAGTTKSKDCTLCLTEGLSAKALVIAGFSSVDRSYWGCFPCRGKFINTFANSASMVAANTEYQAIKKTLALVSGETYTKDNITSLRYGSILICTDQDTDGFHCGSLLMNMFNHEWPSLLELGYVKTLRTPVVVATLKKNPKDKTAFYSTTSYDTWAEDKDISKFVSKYYKGLGSSGAADGREYFKNLNKNVIHYQYNGQEDLNMMFDKKRSDDRKQWLATVERPADHDNTLIPIKEFRDRSLYDFTIDVNERSIADVVDGLKPSQRKVMWCLMETYGQSAYKDEIKVAQLGARTSERSLFHHGESNMFDTIIRMANDYVGSNNINVLNPIGQFGTRRMGGEDAAAPRYIFTNLSKITEKIYKDVDRNILDYRVEEGHSIEPENYYPIIPMLLCNGCVGIGLAYSTSIPQYNPKDLVENIKLRLNNQPFKEMTPWYRGFTGSVTKINGKDGYEIKGKYSLVGKTLTVTELPIGLWTDKFTEHLNALCDKSVVRNYKNDSGITNIAYSITLVNEMSAVELEKAFKLKTTISVNNMVAFKERRLKQYASVNDILEDYFRLSLAKYGKRREFIISSLTEQIKKLDIEKQLITLIVEDAVVVFRRKRDDVTEQLKPYQLEGYTGLLLGFSMSRFTLEEIEKLGQKIADLQAELVQIQGKTSSQLWLEDLGELEKAMTKA